MDQDFLVTWFVLTETALPSSNHAAYIRYLGVGIIVLALVGLREDFTGNTFGKDHEMNLVSLVRVYIAH